MRLGGTALKRAMGIAPKRTLPEFARTPLTVWCDQRDNTRSEQAARETEAHPVKRVVLFNDTFNTYQEPAVGRAAVELLEKLGYSVSLSGHRCCGRTTISAGLVETARELALETVSVLYERAAAGIPIVGLEPSCILSLRDEYAALLPDDPRVEIVAEQAMTLEEFVTNEAEAGRISSDNWSTGSRKALLHGHCHQKALVGNAPSKRALELAGFEVEIPDSGCCGMAGSFGYESEHYDWSIKMAERVLAPAVRAADEETVIVASGTSCRVQIADTTERRAKHLAEVLLEAL